MKRKKIKTPTPENCSNKAARNKRENYDLKVHEYSCTCSVENLLPWWFPWFVTIATVAVRVYYVYQPQSWWILHPDEVFQSVEVAFADVYGYGFYPYEYLPSPTNITTAAVKQTAKMGMYSLRSFLYPKAFAVVMEIAKWTGVELAPFMVCRIFNAVVTSTLPLAVYLFVRRIFRCHVVSCLSCALTASCVQLVMFGTHCIVNSFTSPFLFFGLLLCLPSQNNSSFQSLKVSKQKKYSDMNGNVSSHSKVTCIKNDFRMSVLNNGLVKVKDSSLVTTAVISDNDDTEFYVGSKTTVQKNDQLNPVCRKDVQSQAGFIKHKRSLQQKRTQRMDLFLICIRHLFGGCLIGIIFYIRPDVSLPFGVLYLSVLFTEIKICRSLRFEDLKTDILLTMIGACVGPFIGTLYDCWRFQRFVIPPLQWIKFNLLTNSSSVLFGTKDFREYNNIIFYNSYYEYLFIIVTLFYSYKYLFDERESQAFKNSISIQLSFTVLLICHLSMAQKEARFLHNFIALYFIIISYGLHIILEVAKQFEVKKSVILSGVFTVLLSFCFNTYNIFPSASDITARHLAYKSAVKSKEVNICLNFISKSKDVRGVMLDASVFESNGFSILQHDVPLLTKIHNEYRLYTSSHVGKDMHWKRIRVLNKYDDFIDVHNSQYLSKILGRTNTFNYIVTKRVKFYKGMKYNEIFKSGSHSVLLRNLTDYHEKQLNKLADELPLGNNATILEYETNWLLTSGLHELAVARAKQSLDLDQSKVRVFQQLMVAYARMEKWDDARKYQKLCFSLHGREACETPQEKLVLYDEYRQLQNS